MGWLPGFYLQCALHATTVHGNNSVYLAVGGGLLDDEDVEEVQFYGGHERAPICDCVAVAWLRCGCSLICPNWATGYGWGVCGAL